MAQSQSQSEQFTSESFVESVGAVLFWLSTREICVLKNFKSNEYVLAKGRRSCGESRQAAALREVSEETGFSCRLLPLNMRTRATPAGDREKSVDEARLYVGVSEPFALQVRRLGEGEINLVWWYVAAIEEEAPMRERGVGEKGRYAVEFYNCKDVVGKLTSEADREMVAKAVELVESTYPAASPQTVVGTRKEEGMTRGAAYCFA